MVFEYSPGTQVMTQARGVNIATTHFTQSFSERVYMIGLYPSHSIDWVHLVTLLPLQSLVLEIQEALVQEAQAHMADMAEPTVQIGV